MLPHVSQKKGLDSSLLNTTKGMFYKDLLPASLGASPVPQMVKNQPAMRENQVGSLGWEDLLEKGLATHSSVLAWRIPWTEEPGGLQSMAP